MRILLTNSYLGRSEPAIFPLGLAYIATALTDHEVVCFDINVYENGLNEFKKQIYDTDPEVIGISLRNIDTVQSFDVWSYWSFFIQTVHHAKMYCQNAIIVVGGSGFSLFAPEIMNEVSEIDFGILLEGEESFPELLNNLDKPESVKGVYYRTDHQILFTGYREFLDFNRLPIPMRDHFNLSRYKRIGIQTKRGCANKCIYCTYPFLTGTEIRQRSPINVVNEIEQLTEEFNKREIFFSDNIFNWPADHAEAICQEIINRGVDIKWTAYFTVKGLSDNFLRLAIQSGCVNFTFSPDGFSDSTLKTLGKGMRQEQVLRAFSLFKQYPAADFKCGFIWNSPGTSLKDLFDILRMVNGVVRMKNNAGVYITTMRILPRTILYNKALEENRVSSEDNLLTPVYYDPYPWKIVSVIIQTAGRLLRIMRRTRSKFMKVK